MVASVKLGMVGILVEDMRASLAFYRTLRLDIPEGAEEMPHVEKEIEGGVTLFWDSSFAKTYDPEREAPTGGYRVLIEFFVDDKGAVDARYEEMVGYGYHGHREPFDTDFGARMAMVDDPDGNTVLISAAS